MAILLTFNLINAQAVITNHRAYCNVGNIIAVAQAEQAKFLLFNLPGVVIAVAAGKRAFIIKISDAVLHMRDSYAISLRRPGFVASSSTSTPLFTVITGFSASLLEGYQPCSRRRCIF